MKTKTIIKIAISVATICALVGVYFFTPLNDYLGLDKITEVTQDVPETWLTALIFIGIFILGGCLLTPIPLMAFAVSLVFDIWLSVLIVIPGFLLASLSGYSLGRLIDTETFGSKVQSHIDSIKDKVDDKGAWAVVALRLAPTPPFTVTSIIAGALEINVFKYALASTLGIMPLGLSAVFFGRGAIEMMSEPSGIAATSIVAAILLFILYTVVKKKKSANQEA